MSTQLSSSYLATHPRSNLQPLNLGLNPAWKYTQDREHWKHLTETATLQLRDNDDDGLPIILLLTYLLTARHDESATVYTLCGVELVGQISNLLLSRLKLLSVIFTLRPQTLKRPFHCLTTQYLMLNTHSHNQTSDSQETVPLSHDSVSHAKHTQS